jgi:hypothetical protein
MSRVLERLKNLKWKAILMLPVRMEVIGNWFKLNDPEHLIVPTRRMLEQGWKVQELKQSVALACNANRYRPGDLRTLAAKVQQLDAMLPMQSRVVQLPFENTASGFELFSEGATALLSELAGFDGVDLVPEGVTTEVFVFGKYFNIHETRVIVGGIPLHEGEYDVISREVLQVRLPDNAVPTVTEDGKPYLEVHVATPNGISNRLLVPFKPKPQLAAPAPPEIAYSLSPGSSPLTVDYQWLNLGDGKPLRLVASVDPGDKPILINWVAPTGIAPRTLQVFLDVKVDPTRSVRVSLTANGGDSGPYKIDNRQLIVCLLAEAQSGKVVIDPATLPATVTADVYVMPEKGNYRVDPAFKKLADPLAINFRSTVTNTDALKNVTCPAPPPPPSPPPSPPPGPAPKDAPKAMPEDLHRTTGAARLRDDDVLPTTLQIPLPPAISTAQAAAEQAAGLGGNTLPQLASSIAQRIAQGAAQPPSSIADLAKALAAAANPQPAAQPIVVAPAQPNIVVVAPHNDQTPKRKQHPLARLLGLGKSSR